MAQLVGYSPLHQKVACSILDQETMPGSQVWFQVGVCRSSQSRLCSHIDVFLSHSPFSLEKSIKIFFKNLQKMVTVEFECSFPMTPSFLISLKKSFWCLIATKFRGINICFSILWIFLFKCLFSCFTEKCTIQLYKFLPLEVCIPFVTVFKSKCIIILLLPEQTLPCISSVIILQTSQVIQNKYFFCLCVCVDPNKVTLGL